MTLQEFGDKLNEIRARNGWTVETRTGPETALGQGLGVSFGPIVGVKIKDKEHLTLTSFGCGIKPLGGFEAGLTFDPTGGYYEFFIGVGAGAEAEFFVDPASVEFPIEDLIEIILDELLNWWEGL